MSEQNSDPEKKPSVSSLTSELAELLQASVQTPSAEPPIPRPDASTPSVPEPAGAPKEKEALPNLSRTAVLPSDVIDLHSVYRLIDVKGSLSTIEITLTAITVAVIVLKISFAELATQIGALLTGGSARLFLDVSVAVGFVAIVVATFQIPRHFTDALVYSNQETMRVLFVVGATPRFVALCFSRVVSKAMFRAIGRGLIATAILYLLISEVAQLWIPVTRTYFLREVAEAVAAIFVFTLIVGAMVRVKVYRFYQLGMHY